MMPRPYICNLIFLLCSAFLLGQENGFVSGTVIDQNTGEPVVFATVRIKGKAKGVITNMDGSFRLPEQFKVKGESIEVSSLGYQKKEVPFSELSSTSLNKILLVPGALELTEAVVTANKKREPSARRIVRKAIANILLNFPTNDFAAKGYYRDYQLDSLGYVNLNEALLEVQDGGFDKIDMETTKVRMYDYIKNKSFRIDSLADDPYNYEDWGKIMDKAYLPAYGGNEFVLLRVHDAVRNYQINTFDFIGNMSKGDILRNHEFKRLQDIYADNEEVYKISMTKKEPGFTIVGRIYIAKKDYAIYKLAYGVYDHSKKGKGFVLQEKDNDGQLLFEVTTEYKRGKDDKMYPSYISFHNTFRLAEPPKFAVTSLTVLPQQGAFAVRFNNPLASVRTRFGRRYGQLGEPKADGRRWYDFRYNDKKLRFQNVQIVDENTVYLYPKMEEKELNTMMEVLVTMSREKRDIGRVLKFKVSGLEDEDGNSLNTRLYKDYNQFREFFVQEIDHSPPKIEDGLFMDEEKPIFKDQPISKPDDFDDYWMNTPLKTTRD